jgi:hypothetical protein
MNDRTIKPYLDFIILASVVDVIFHGTYIQVAALEFQETEGNVD